MFPEFYYEIHRAMAARDAYSSYGGYHSRRATESITYHKKHGGLGRITLYQELHKYICNQ